MCISMASFVLFSGRSRKNKNAKTQSIGTKNSKPALMSTSTSIETSNESEISSDDEDSGNPSGEFVIKPDLAYAIKRMDIISL